MMVMTSLKYSLPWRSRLAFPLPNSFPCPLMAYSWQKSSTLQNSSSKLIVDTSCWCDYPQGYSFLAQEVSFFLIPNSRYLASQQRSLEHQLDSILPGIEHDGRVAVPRY